MSLSVHKYTIYSSVLLLYLLLPKAEAACTDQYGRCKIKYTSDREFFRTWWGLTEVPPDIPVDALAVYLWGNAITSLPAGVFSNLVECKKLNLQANQISIVHKEAFARMRSLEVLSLGQNNISAIEAGTFNLPQCQVLYLQQNVISSLAAGTFTHLVKCTHLDLEENKISSLEKNTFTGLLRLRNLSLSGKYHILRKEFSIILSTSNSSLYNKIGSQL